jgi:hypothetical protein
MAWTRTRPEAERGERSRFAQRMRVCGDRHPVRSEVVRSDSVGLWLSRPRFGRRGALCRGPRIPRLSIDAAGEVRAEREASLRCV